MVWQLLNGRHSFPQFWRLRSPKLSS
jgi:hypothetical protein